MYEDEAGGTCAQIPNSWEQVASESRILWNMQESPPANIKINALECLLAFLGSLVAGTLWLAHRANIQLPCTEAEGVRGCDLVNESRWAHVTMGPLHDLPVALLGFLTYLALLAFSVVKIASESHKTVALMLRAQWALAAFGFGYSWYLQYVAKYKVGGFCIWCRGSAWILTALFLVITYELILSRRKDTAPRTEPADETPAGVGQ
jgi:uncharacterized membrane protein